VRPSISHIALVVKDYNEMIAKGIGFRRDPKKAEYGTVAVFEELYGNLWDLIEFGTDSDQTT
jgi:hypothetical protein